MMLAEEEWLTEKEANIITVEKWGDESLAENAETHQIRRESALEPKPCDWIQSGAHDKRLFWWINECFYFTGPPGVVGLKEQFEELASKWKDETSDYSLLALRYANDSFLRIVGFGPIAIPWILEELRNEPDWWFEALKAMSGTDPAQNASSFDDAVAAWLEWGSELGYA